jgi:cation:H+ antiporter
MFIDGYNIIDGLIFAVLFLLYIILAYIEARRRPDTYIEIGHLAITRKGTFISIILFIIGGIGLLIGAEPFVKSVEEIAISIGIPAAIVAIILSPIAGELPEKFSMMILASKGGEAVSISIANVLGSKILNNTLLLACMIFGAVYFYGYSLVIQPNGLLLFMVYWTAILTLISTSLMFDRKLTRSDGLLLTTLYVGSIVFPFLLLPI